MSQPDTKQRILDVAERLFATRGFHATSLRAITRAAEVNLAAVNYHFGSKDALLEAVMLRRLGPLNEIRQARLDQNLQVPRHPRLALIQHLHQLTYGGLATGQ